MMLRKSLLIISLLFVIPSLFAFVPISFDWGVKMGVSIGGATRMTMDRQEWRIATPHFTGGVTFDVHSYRWGIVTELLFIRKSVMCRLPTFQSPITLYDYNGVEQANPLISTLTGRIFGAIDNRYIEIPLLISYSYLQGRARVAFGGYYAYLLQSKTKIQINGYLGSSESFFIDERLYYKEHTRPFDFGVKVNNQWQYGHFRFGMDLSVGVINIIDPAWRGNNIVFRNLTGSIYIGYVF